MKKRFLTILLALFVVCTLAFMVACKPSSETEEPICRSKSTLGFV